MNKRIKELAIQCGIMFEPTKQNRVHSVSTETLQKFADLIIKECVESSDNTAILKHFESNE